MHVIGWAPGVDGLQVGDIFGGWIAGRGRRLANGRYERLVDDIEREPLLEPGAVRPWRRDFDAPVAPPVGAPVGDVDTASPPPIAPEPGIRFAPEDFRPPR